MSHLMLLLALDARLLSNRYFRTRRGTLSTLGMLLLIIALGAGLTLASRHLLVRGIGPGGDLALLALPMGMMVLVSLLLLASSVQSVARNFYRSPDLALLMATPIPGDALVTFKLLSHIRATAGGAAMGALPLLVATGMVLDAHFSYYLALPLLYLLVAVVSVMLGVILGMLGMGLLPPRLFTAISTGLPAALGIGGWGLYLLARVSPGLLAPLKYLLEQLAEGRWIVDLIPPLAAGRLAMQAAAGRIGDAWSSGALLLATAAAVAAAALPATRRLFRQGWLRSLPTPPRAQPPGRATGIGPARVRLAPVLSVALLELRFAARNREMWSAALGALVMYVGPVALVLGGSYLPGRETGIAFLMVLAGSLFATMAAAVPFYTLDMMPGSNLLADRFWLLRLLPVTGGQVLGGRFLAHMALALPCALSGLLALALVRSPGAAVLLAACAATTLFTGAMTALHLGWEVLVLHRFGGGLGPLATIASYGLDAALIILGPGLLAAHAWRDVVSQLPVLGWVPGALGGYGTAAISVAVGLAFLVLSLRVGINSWSRLEI